MRRALLFLCTLAPLAACTQLFAQTQTQATAIALELPCAMAYDSAGNLLFAERGGNLVRRLSPAGTLTTIAGTGVEGFSGDGGPATSAELDGPCGLAVDSSGNLFLADTRNHRIRKVAASTGIITTIAGTGTAGFSGDGGPATAATLDAPTALALDPAGDLFIADTRNHRIREITASTGVIRTIAGTGVEGFSGDGGPATSAELDSPSGLAIDSSGNLLIADSRNHRIREIAASTGLIRTVAGSGTNAPGLPAFAQDNAAATTSTLALPHGLSVDSSGNIFIADTADHRIRRIDTTTGTITTVAGAGVEGFSGDQGRATAAQLDSPRAVALSPSGLVTLSDTANGRIRQLDATATPGPDIHTIAGLGAAFSTGGLVLSGPSVTAYGSGSVTAVLANGSAATGSITFLDGPAASPVVLSSVPLANGAAVLNTSSLAAGSHTLTATYPGDSTHASEQSTALALTVTPLPVIAAAQSTSVLYGQPLPALTGTIIGVLPQDSGKLSAVFSIAASAIPHAGTYPIAAALTGPAAPDYIVGSTTGTLTIAQAATTTTLTLTSATSGAIAVQVASTTTGTPTGSVSLLDGAATLASLPLTAGSATYTSAALTTGTHTITAIYPGDTNFLASSSAALKLTAGTTSGTGTSGTGSTGTGTGGTGSTSTGTGTGSSGSGTGSTGSPGSPGTAAPDFALATTGSTTQSVASGSAAVFTFSMTPLNGGLASPVNLTVSGLATGMTSSFNPAYLPPSAAPTAFTLTIQTSKLARLQPLIPASGPSGVALAGLFAAPFALVLHRRRRPNPTAPKTFPVRQAIFTFAVGILFATLATGCGDRVNVGTEAAAPTYTFTVTGTATSASGAPVQHAVTVTLKVL